MHKAEGLAWLHHRAALLCYAYFSTRLLIWAEGREDDPFNMEINFYRVLTMKLKGLEGNKGSPTDLFWPPRARLHLPCLDIYVYGQNTLKDHIFLCDYSPWWWAWWLICVGDNPWWAAGEAINYQAFHISGAVWWCDASTVNTALFNIHNCVEPIQYQSIYIIKWTYSVYPPLCSVCSRSRKPTRKQIPHTNQL